MQIVTCFVVPAGDEKLMVERGPDRPVSYPEALLLAAIHGKENVRDIRLLHDEDRDNDEERTRLALIYGDEKVQAVFGAAHQPLPEGDARLVTKAKRDAARAKALAEADAKTAAAEKAAEKAEG